VVEQLPSKYEILSLNPRTAKIKNIMIGLWPWVIFLSYWKQFLILIYIFIILTKFFLQIILVQYAGYYVK
jgi:hypothetical protein